MLHQFRVTITAGGVALEGGLKGGALGCFQNLAYSCWFLQCYQP